MVVVGDFNDFDTPASAPLAPLLQGTNLRDISIHPFFDHGGRPANFGNCTAANGIDYILLSPALCAKATDAASDHAAICADLQAGMGPHGHPEASARPARGRWNTGP